MLPRNHLDRIRIAFDNHRLVANAGLLLPATLARHLGLRELVDHHLELGGTPGRATSGDKLMTLAASALAGGDCIDDADVWRTGGTARTMGGTVKAPSTLGTFLRSFRWGHVRQLDRVSRQLLVRGLGRWGGTRRRAVHHRPRFHHLRDLRTGQGGRATPRLHRQAGLSPTAGRRRRHRRGADVPSARGPRQHRPGRRPLPARDGGAVRYAGARGQLAARADSGFYTHSVVSVCRKLDLRFSITIRQYQNLRDLIEAIPEDDWMPIPYWMDSAAPVRLIVQRVRPTPGSQLALFATYSYHGFIADRDGETLELEVDHRRHDEIENAIRDLKYGVGLNHMPSGRFAANGACLAVQVMAHNLARWTARIGLGERTVTTKTLRRRVFALAGRITRSARRLTLHLPQHWPWETLFTHALARLRALPLPA